MNDPKPQKRYRATRKEWVAIVGHFTGEVCWVCGDSWDQLHHILSRGAGRGDDVTVNLAPVCLECHARIEARDSVARSLIRQALLPSNYVYLRYKLRDTLEGWLARNYPATDASAYPRDSHTRDEELTTTTTKELTTLNSSKVYSKAARITTDPASV